MAVHITHPADIDLPREVRAVVARLEPEGLRAFLDELLGAVEDAQREDDLAPFQRVIDAWYRTLILRADPAYAANLRGADELDRGEAHTIEDLRARFARA